MLSLDAILTLQRRARRRRIKAKQRQRWPMVYLTVDPLEARQQAYANGAVTREHQRVGRPRSKYCPHTCQIEGKR